MVLQCITVTLNGREFKFQPLEPEIQFAIYNTEIIYPTQMLQKNVSVTMVKWLHVSSLVTDVICTSKSAVQNSKHVCAKPIIFNRSSNLSIWY